MDKALEQYLAGLTDKKARQSDVNIITRNDPVYKQQSSERSRKFREENPLTANDKKRISNSMRGKTLEELIGEEAAAKGRKARSEASKGKKRPVEVVEKIAATRRATGSYQSDTHGMNGKQHKESTKATMQIKAKIRQELKRTLGMGRAGKLPKALLEAEYKKAGI
jgi:hypothetical protein